MIITAYYFDENKFISEYENYICDVIESRKSLIKPIDRSFNWWFIKKQIKTDEFSSHKLENITNYGNFTSDFIKIDNDYLWSGFIMFNKHEHKISNYDGVYYSWKSIKLYEKYYKNYYNKDFSVLSCFSKTIERDLKLDLILK
jgi:hypothetical protein